MAAPSVKIIAVLLTVFQLCFQVARVNAEPYDPCSSTSCYPPTGDLLIGRNNRLETSSASGEQENQTNNIENVINNGLSKDKKWRSNPGEEKVSIGLNLEAEFVFTKLIINFGNARPGAMLIEKSRDFGRTWKVYQYFAKDCKKSFPGVSTALSRNLTEIYCDSRFSNVKSPDGNQVVFKTLPSRIPLTGNDMHTMMDHVAITNLRIKFTEFDRRNESKDGLFYEIKNMTVQGTCSCNGHAARCVPMDENEPRVENMVYGACDCRHNTKGTNCESCKDLYNDLPWKPALGLTTNACHRCNCPVDVQKCHFDPLKYDMTGQVSGGVCDH